MFPEAVEGCSVLDLGSGAGLDCFVLSKLVGPDGHVTGVDMTPEQVRPAYRTSRVVLCNIFTMVVRKTGVA